MRLAWFFVPIMLAFAATCDSAEELQTVLGGAENPNGVTYFPDTVASCTACSIELVRHSTIGRVDDPILFRRFPKLVRDSRARTIGAAPAIADHQIIVFDSAGQFIRTVGGHGEGPGEFRRVNDIALGSADSLYVVHDSYNVSVFDSAANYSRTISRTNARVDRILPFRDGIVANGRVASDQLSETPLHILNNDGTFGSSFGEANWLTDSGGHERLLGRGPGKALWVATNNQYRFEKLDLEGRKLRVIAVAAPRSWHTITYTTRQEYEESIANAEIVTAPSPAARPARALFPPFFRVSGVHERPDGRLFVSLLVAADDWQEVELEYEDIPGETVLTDATKEKQYKTIVDAIDTETGEVRARTEIDGYGYVANDGTLIRLSVTEIGLIQAEIYTIRFVDSNRPIED